jgi:hypothetical protein
LGFVAPTAGGFGRTAIQAAAGVAEATVAGCFAAAIATAATHSGRATATAFAGTTSTTACTSTAPTGPGDQLSRLVFKLAGAKGHYGVAWQGNHTSQHQPKACQRSSQGRIHLPTPLHPSS